MTVTFKTLGCRLNQAETNTFATDFLAQGITAVKIGAAADIVVVHSCAVTGKAEAQSLKQLQSLRRQYPRACLVIAGCAVETATADKLRQAGADLIVPQSQKQALVTLVVQHLNQPPRPSPRPPTPPKRVHRALLKVQDGCDFFCHYCIIPYTRGAPQSRSLSDCITAAQHFITQGYREIVVTGCNLACYNHRGATLIDLLQALLALPGLGRLRLGSIEPGTIENEVLDLMLHEPRLCPFLHLPLQSADDQILQAMGRRYDTAYLKNFVAQARRRHPTLALGADLICGFPGEDAASFARTYEIMQHLNFSNLHVFPYSERPGTPACDFTGSVPMATRKARAKKIIELGQNQRQAYLQSFVGRAVAVLVEKHDPRTGLGRGWSAEYLPCQVQGAATLETGAIYYANAKRVHRGLLECFSPSSSHAP